MHGIFIYAADIEEKIKLSKTDPSSILYLVIAEWKGGSSFSNLEADGVLGDSLNKALNLCLKSKLHFRCAIINTVLRTSTYSSSEEKYKLSYKSAVRGYSALELQDMELDNVNSEFREKFAMNATPINVPLFTQSARGNALLSAKLKCESKSCDFCMHEKLTDSYVGQSNNSYYTITAEATVSCYKRKSLEKLRIERYPELNELPGVPSLKSL